MSPFIRCRTTSFIRRNQRLRLSNAFRQSPSQLPRRTASRWRRAKILDEVRRHPTRRRRPTIRRQDRRSAPASFQQRFCLIRRQLTTTVDRQATPSKCRPIRKSGFSITETRSNPEIGWASTCWERISFVADPYPLFSLNSFKMFRKRINTARGGSALLRRCIIRTWNTGGRARCAEISNTIFLSLEGLRIWWEFNFLEILKWKLMF